MPHLYNLGDLVSFEGNTDTIISRLTPDKPALHPCYLLSLIGPPVFEVDITKIENRIDL